MVLKLIPGWQRAWRLSSVKAAVLLLILSGLQLEVLPLIQGLVPPAVWPWVSGSIAMAIVVLRVIAQPGALDKPEVDQ